MSEATQGCPCEGTCCDDPRVSNGPPEGHACDTTHCGGSSDGGTCEEIYRSECETCGAVCHCDL